MRPYAIMLDLVPRVFVDIEIDLCCYFWFLGVKMSGFSYKTLIRGRMTKWPEIK